MIIDQLEHAHRYYSVHSRIKEAFDYIAHTDLATMAPGKYEIDGDELFAIVQEYDTMDAAKEQMESHRKYADVQYMINGTEQVGLAVWGEQEVSRSYNSDDDYMLYADKPSFWSTLAEGMFMIFFPTDLHMPCIQAGAPMKVKKVVVKVRMAEANNRVQ